jgi:hypothetical protein
VTRSSSSTDQSYACLTQPALNGYIYPKQLMKLTFARIRNDPKVEALVLVKGPDRTSTLSLTQSS